MGTFEPQFAKSWNAPRDDIMFVGGNKFVAAAMVFTVNWVSASKIKILGEIADP